MPWWCPEWPLNSSFNVRRLSSNLLPLRGVTTLHSWTEWVSAGAKITRGIPSGNRQSQTNAALFMCLCWPVYWNITMTHSSSLSLLLVFSLCQAVHCFCCEALPLCTLERSGCRQKHILQEPPFGGRLPVYNQCMLLSWARIDLSTGTFTTFYIHKQREALVFRHHCCTFLNLKVPIEVWSNLSSSTRLAWVE